MSTTLSINRDHPAVRTLLLEFGNDDDVTEVGRDLREAAPMAGIDAGDHEPLAIAHAPTFSCMILRHVRDGRLGTLYIDEGGGEADGLHIASARYAPIRRELGDLRHIMKRWWARRSEMSMPMRTLEAAFTDAVEIEEPRVEVLRRDALRLNGVIAQAAAVAASLEDETVRGMVADFARTSRTLVAA